MRHSELEARIRIALVPGLGPTLTRRLERHFGGPEAACAAPASQLKSIRGIDPPKAELIRRLLDEADVAGELQAIQRHGARVVALDDPAYPPLLKHIIDPPPLLYVRGELDRRDSLALAIVGSRKCSLYGREQADRFASICGQAGMTIVSGGALGIDAAAHRAALRVKARTIAVLGCGLGRCYPPEHKELYEQIASGGGGAVISELPMNAPPIAENFPARNRIISGLSLGVLVVEAADRSGALITARLAAEEHHREVMALPGRVDSASSAGCHRIVREGWATLVTSPAEALDALGEAGSMLKTAMKPRESDAERPVDAPASMSLSPDQNRIYQAIDATGVTIDSIVHATGLAIGVIQSSLMQMQLVGLLERLPANRVRRKPRS